MTGHQFRAIRKFNGISQETICNHSNYSHRASIYRIEQMPFIPQEFVNILSRLTRINLNDPQNVERYYMQLPTKYRNYDPSRTSNSFLDNTVVVNSHGNEINKEKLFNMKSK